MIVVTGAPAAGKTRLAKQISKQLRIPMLSKDDVKEALFERIGVEDRETSHILGRGAIQSILNVGERILKAKVDVILEANFDRETESAVIRDLAKKTRARLLQVYVDCDSTEAFERYQQRVVEEDRHPGHFDAVNIQEWRISGIPIVEPLDLPGETIEVDTADRAAVDVDAVVEQVRAFVEA